jgi:hypothetical protein
MARHMHLHFPYFKGQSILGNHKLVAPERRFTMKSFRFRSLALAAVALLAASTFVASTSAQSPASFKGSFTLADEVTWASNSLPSGEYTFDLKSANTLPAQLVLRGPHGAVILLSGSVTRRQDSGQSFVALEHRNGSDYVRQIYLAPLGVHFYYPVPKPAKEQWLAQNSSRQIPVSTTGK